jgi:hypothetical protein
MFQIEAERTNAVVSPNIIIIYYESELPTVTPVKHINAHVTYNTTFRYFKIIFTK